jgi:hypothetical protein
MMGVSGDRSSKFRKDALRRLAREFHDEYLAMYREEIHREVGDGPYDAKVLKRCRGKAWTRLRNLHEDRYLELFEQAKLFRSDVPAKIRTAAWQRASKRLIAAEQVDFRVFLPAVGTSWEERRVRALVKLRKKHPRLFDRYLQEEVDWLVRQEH